MKHCEKCGQQLKVEQDDERIVMDLLREQFSWDLARLGDSLLRTYGSLMSDNLSTALERLIKRGWVRVTGRFTLELVRLEPQ